MKSLFLFLAFSFTSGLQAEEALMTRLQSNWRRWATRTVSEQIYQKLIAQMTDLEGPLVLSGNLQLAGQYHKRPGHFVFVVGTLNYKNLEFGNQRLPYLKLEFAEFMAGMFRIREEMRQEFPSFRLVVNTRRDNDWINSSMLNIGAVLSCDAILSGNNSYKRLILQFP